jgi:hypothetical protein
MKTGLFLTCTLPLLVFAAPSTKKENTHREHTAHVHGGASIAIAFDELKGKIEFKGAAKGILGFEHQAKTEKDKKAVSHATQIFETDIGKMVQFEPSLNCQISKEMIGQIPEAGNEGSGEHSDWAANFAVTCEKSPLGSKLTVDLTNFKQLTDVDITVLAGSVQKSAEFKGRKPVVIELR